ncbi:MAG: hypothetical protein IJW53_03420 [Clostridia bacterium]|nr:hypothetical protein [Clostridia bacterium]
MKILETVKNFIKKNKKLVTVVSAMFCAVVLVAGSIAGTIAYLTSQATVTNTFTVGDIEIKLVESKVDVYGALVSDADPVTENEYKLIPGHEYTKDPKVTVVANSEDCYLFVKVVNGISAIEVATGNGDTIAEQLTAKGWVNLSGDIWYYNTKITLKDTDQEISVFESFTLKNDVDVTGYATSDNSDSKIVVTAYAVQSNGFTSKGTLAENVTDAWNATFGATP